MGTRVSIVCDPPGCSKPLECSAYKAELACLEKQKCKDQDVKDRIDLKKTSNWLGVISRS